MLKSKPPAEYFIINEGNRVDTENDDGLPLELEKTIHQHTERIQREPNNYVHYYTRAGYWQKADQHYKAIQDINLGTVLDTEKIANFSAIVCSWISLGEYHKAIQECKIVISSHPKNFHCFVLRGIVLQ